MGHAGDGRCARNSTARLILLALLLALTSTQGTAQDPDTIPDNVTIPIPPEMVQDDTVPDTGEVTDSIFPAPALPEYPDPAPGGFAWGRWQWSPDELSRYHGLSLLDLLDQVPGLDVTRAGGFGRPTGLSTFGTGGARLRVFVDGYELDPLVAASYDLQNIGIADLGSLVVERELHEIRIEISTFDLPDSRPFSRVEVGAGNYDTKLLRALFSRTIGTRNVVMGAFGLASTRGIGIAEPFTRKAGSISLTHMFSENYGVRARYRFTGVERQSTLEGYPQLFDENSSRQDFIVSGRARLSPDLTIDAIVGRSWRAPSDSTSFVDLDLASTQAVVRAAYQRASIWADGGVRSRFGDSRGIASPDHELFASAGIHPLQWISLSGNARAASSGDLNGTELSVTARAGGWGGFSIFGTASTGDRALGLLRNSTYAVDTTNVDTTVFSFPQVLASGGGLRAGAEWTRGDAVVGVAALSLLEGRTVPFGAPFDARAEPHIADASTGVEAYLALPLFFAGARVEGSFTAWSETGTRPYLPSESGRLALSFHEVYYDGQFEPTFRIEGLRRGSALVPDLESRTFSALSDGYNLLNVYLELRIQDIQAYIGWDNLLNDLEARDLPAFAPRVPRMMYGVSWRFQN